ncbi:TonB-dependent receptor domain-containing protein, partial [Escherichia coli]
ARTYTIGTVLTPRFLPGFDFTADYYHTRIANTIGSLDTSTFLSNCYNSVNLSSPFCAQVAPRDSLGQLTLVNSPTQNLGETRTEGLDFGLGY